jgi:8-oxo-dGTP pyrophosphatase MutT (NUDIX family)
MASTEQLATHLRLDHQITGPMPTTRDELDDAHAADHALNGETGAHDTAPHELGIEVAKAGIEDEAQPVAAGLAVIAEDTGRLLMLQRALDESDPASGCWEFPGGCLEADEQPLAAAWREWAEEVGQIVPPGRAAGMWSSPNGIYQGFVWVIECEALVSTNADERPVTNPDDPDGDQVETVAWMPIDHLEDFAGLRREVAESTDWNQLAQIVAGLSVVAKATTVGIVAGTGIEGIDLAGADTAIPEDEQLPEDVRRMLAQWRKNARTRVGKGLPPRRFDDVPEVIAVEVWPVLEHATTREQVDEAFEVVKRRVPKG